MKTRIDFEDVSSCVPWAEHIAVDTMALDLLITLPFENSAAMPTRPYLSMMAFRDSKTVFCFAVTGSLPNFTSPLDELGFIVDPARLDSKFFVIHGSRSMLSEQLILKHFLRSVFIETSGDFFERSLLEREFKQISTFFKQRGTLNKLQILSLLEIKDIIKTTLNRCGDSNIGS